jgi:hypothetical protein
MKNTQKAAMWHNIAHRNGVKTVSLPRIVAQIEQLQQQRHEISQAIESLERFNLCRGARHEFSLRNLR